MNPSLMNWGLALFLLAGLALVLPIPQRGIPLDEFWSGPSALEWTNLGLYLTATIILVSNTIQRRTPEAQDRRPLVFALCLFSSLYWLGYEGELLSWPLVLLHLVGDLGLVYLGRSFAILPALRRVKTQGPYRWVRHPTYATYLAADSVFLYASFSLQNAIVAVLGGLSLWARALLEERVLGQSEQYRNYLEQTPHRFIPGLF